MFRKLDVALINLLFVALCGPGFASEGTKDDQSTKWEPLVKQVQDILAGKNVEQTQSFIASGAHVVVGTRIESLLDVVTGKNKTCSLIETSSAEPVSLQLKMNDAEDAAYLILGMQSGNKENRRLHTVVFMKDSAGKWKIESWHTSN